MHIALDYDGTYTLKPATWDAAIDVLIAGGFHVSIVTARDDRHDDNADLQRLAAQGLAVHFTRGFAKKAWMAREATNPVTIWIDDNPESIIENSRMTRDELSVWRAKQRSTR